MDKQGFLSTIPGLEEIFVVFSLATKMPYVSCHKDTFDDYIMVYLVADEASAKIKELVEEKIPCSGVKIAKKSILAFLSELRATGVNAILFRKGEEEYFVQLTEILKFPDESDKANKPIENAELHLSMIYMMQEVRKDIPKEEKKNLAELEEETSANISKARFLLPVQETEGEVNGEDKGINRAVMLLKNDKEQVFIPLFTDIPEIRKFTKGKEVKMITADFKGVIKLLSNGTPEGVVINPGSSSVMVSKEGIVAIARNFLTNK